MLEVLRILGALAPGPKVAALIDKAQIRMALVGIVEFSTSWVSVSIWRGCGGFAFYDISVRCTMRVGFLAVAGGAPGPKMNGVCQE